MLHVGLRVSGPVGTKSEKPTGSRDGEAREKAAGIAPRRLLGFWRERSSGRLEPLDRRAPPRPEPLRLAVAERLVGDPPEVDGGLLRKLALLAAELALLLAEG